MSQAPQHFGSSETRATCDGCFSCQSICLVIYFPSLRHVQGNTCTGVYTLACSGQYMHRSLHSGMSRAIHAQEFTLRHVQGNTCTGVYTPACPGQYMHRSLHSGMSRAIHAQEFTLRHVQGNTCTGVYTPACSGQYMHRSLHSGMSRAIHAQEFTLRHVQGNTCTGVYEGGCRPLTHFSLGFPFHFSPFVAVKLIESVKVMACVFCQLLILVRQLENEEDARQARTGGSRLHSQTQWDSGTHTAAEEKLKKAILRPVLNWPNR